MVIRADGEIETEDEEENKPESNSEVEEDLEQPVEGELLVVKRILSLQSVDDTSTPREPYRTSLSSRALTCWQADPSSFPAPRAPSSSNPAYSSSIQFA